jgi:protein-tyrosine kinase
MSKIQEALRRLQSEERPGGPTVPVAKISDRVVDLDDTANLQQVVPAITIDVDTDELQKEGLFAPEEFEREIADQYRQIKRPLIASAFGKRAAKVDGGTIIMITSANASEGKTFSSINLALSMAQERDHYVLLVDADVAKPHISRVFGLGDQPGLLDLVEDPDILPESLVVGTNVKGLSILPAGKPRDNANELLSSNRMEQVVKEFAARYPNRVVLFDSPPLLETAEAKVLLELAGQVVVVVRAERTTQSAVHEALYMIKAEKAVNFVLNQCRATTGQGNYVYGYGYGGYPQNDKPPQESRDEEASLWGQS